MEYKKYVLCFAVIFATSFTGIVNVGAQTPNVETSPAGISTLSGTASSSGAVRKRSNVRTVRSAAATGSTASGTIAIPSTSDAISAEKNSVGKMAAGSPSGNSNTMDAKTTAGIMAAFAILGSAFQILWVVIILFFGFCLYKIASKLGEPHAWLGFIPYVQIYTFVKCGGKSGWWVLWITIGYLALIIPGLILTLIVMHGISTRYGRGGGTTALLFFFPYVMFPVLAFSEPSRTHATHGAGPYVPAYVPNSLASSDQYAVPVANPVASSIFTPDVPNPTPSETVTETIVPPSIEETSVSSASTETAVKEAAPKESAVNNGPGFKLPGA